MEHHDSSAIKYRVEMKSKSLHVECKGLAQVLALMDRQPGPARVLDRLEPDRVFDGTADEFRESLQSKARGLPRFLAQRLKARNDVEEFPVNAALPEPVKGAVQLRQQIGDVLVGALHGRQAACVLAGE